jgi:nucleotide-binding universal stress UspA family protein
VTLDGSNLSEAVVGPISGLAAELDAELILLQVIDWPPPILYPDQAFVVSEPETELNAARSYLAEMADRLHQSVPKVSCRAELGRTPVTITDVAAEENIDLLAMATHGRGGFARLVLGSTATGTLQRTSVPLFLVRGAAQVAPPAPPHEEEGATASVTIPLTRADLGLIRRGLATQIYKPDADPAEVRAAEDLSHRFRTLEATFPSEAGVGA